jgi:hypothetical protein
MTLALQTLRDAAGEDVFIIGCGCPIGPGVGIVDGMRVSEILGLRGIRHFCFPGKIMPFYHVFAPWYEIV